MATHGFKRNLTIEGDFLVRHNLHLTVANGTTWGKDRNPSFSDQGQGKVWQFELSPELHYKTFFETSV